MLKSFFLKVIRVVALTLFIAQFTFSSALAEVPPPPNAVKTPPPNAVNTSSPKPINTPSPKAADTSKVDLKDSNKVDVKDSNQYDIPAIQRFNEGLYGPNG